MTIDSEQAADKHYAVLLLESREKIYTNQNLYWVFYSDIIYTYMCGRQTSVI